MVDFGILWKNEKRGEKGEKKILGAVFIRLSWICLVSQVLFLILINMRLIINENLIFAIKIMFDYIYIFLWRLE
jgi:predicted small integral membrane protein